MIWGSGDLAISRIEEEKTLLCPEEFLVSLRLCVRKIPAGRRAGLCFRGKKVFLNEMQ
jgi:hypothetical protein